MNYGNIKFNDIADGPGIRLSLFVSGCRNRCKGCFNPETWDFNYGEEFTDEVIDEILEELEKPQYQGITILGGDPLEPENIWDVVILCESIKASMPNKDIWLYTGYVLEKRNYQLSETMFDSIEKHENWKDFQKLLKIVDVIVDGPFIEEQKDISLKFRGSKNQRIIDMNKTREQRKIVLWEDK